MSKKEILLTQLKETQTMQAVSSHSNLANFAGNNKPNARGAGAKYDGAQVRVQAQASKGNNNASSNQPKFGYIPVATELAACCACCCALPILAPVALGIKKGVGGIGSSISSMFNRGDKADEAIAK